MSHQVEDESTERPLAGFAGTATYRHAFLAFLLVLLAFGSWVCIQLPPSYKVGRYTNVVVPLMLLFNYLAHAFPWRRRLRISLRILAWSWAAFGLTYVLYHYFAYGP